MSLKFFLTASGALLMLAGPVLAKPLIECRTWKLNDPSQYPAFLKNADPADRNFSLKNADAQESTLRNYESFLAECKGNKSDSKQRCLTGVKYYVQQIANGQLTGLGAYIPCKYVNILTVEVQKQIIADPKKYASEAVSSQY